MVLSLVFVVVGIAGLWFGADWLVRGASRIALALGVEPLFIGLTIVAFGTSAPEMVVCVVAAAQGNTDVALGNVLGSNVANVGLILGLTALATPVRVSLRLAQRELPFMLGVTLVFYALAWRMEFGPIVGILLVVGLLAFTRLALHWALQEPPAVVAEFESFHGDTIARPRFRAAREVGLVVTGLVALVAGGHLLVVGAVDVARSAGVSEFVIAATVVAVGSSLPELATSIVAAMRKEADILVGNLVGSNLFNILGAFGLAAMVRPIEVSPSLLKYEFIGLLVFSAGMALFLRTGNLVRRWEGAVLLVGYVVFVVGLFLR
jgi:cation:H+ antiporter